jgi:quinol monooxygenase YgiN
MFAVVVTLKITPGDMEKFLSLAHINADASKAQEPGCHQFDVATDDDRPEEVFLYEIYDDAEAFSAHLATPHFKAFDEQITEMVREKTILTYAKVRQ